MTRYDLRRLREDYSPDTGKERDTLCAWENCTEPKVYGAPYCKRHFVEIAQRAHASEIAAAIFDRAAQRRRAGVWYEERPQTRCTGFLAAVAFIVGAGLGLWLRGRWGL